MTAAARSVAWQGLKRRALSLGAVKAFDQAMQFLLPMVLARALDGATFGEYRLLWLAIGTLLAVVQMNMLGSLYYFVPRSDAATRRLFVHQTFVYFAVAGVLCGLAISPWNPWLPGGVKPLAHYGLLVPAFVALWVATTPLEHLPTVEERIGWQAWGTLTVSALRVVLVAAGAWATADLGVILWLLIAAVLVRFAILFAYVERWHGFGRPWLSRAAFADHLRHAAPFGASNALYSLRGQADQWVAASLFALHSFAAFSIAGIVGQAVQLVRESVLQAFMPSMSRLQAGGDVAGMLALNNRANLLVATALFPLLGFAFAFAPELITVIYTPAYLEGAPVMRVYIVGMAVMVVEVTSIIVLLRQGPYAMAVSACLLALSVAVSWSLALHAGLAGAAVGSVLAIFVDRVFLLRRVARLTGLPVRRLQPWARLARRFAAAALAAALAWAAAGHFLRESGPMVRMALGAALLALIYVPFNLPFRDKGRPPPA